MAPRLRPSSGFFGVRERPSGRFAAEITADGVRWWIGTFDSAELARLAASISASDSAGGGTSTSRHERKSGVVLRMETLRHDHPELVQAELDFSAKRKKKKAAAARADGAEPSAPLPPPPNRINVGSSSSSSSLGSSFWDSDSDAHVLD
ncbi:hypothetical protein ZWY2020_014397 [Hordeum vulgare]|nr:hypothetical protein ZWY2020_014397 [Hordeum vulgare]